MALDSRYGVQKVTSNASMMPRSPYGVARPTVYSGPSVIRRRATTSSAYLCAERRSPPPDWSVIIGEVAHSLRSALDGLIYQLALLKTKTPMMDTIQQFPIFLVGRSKRPHTSSGGMPAQFEFPRSAKGRLIKQRRFGRSMISNLSPKHQALIEQLQPYKHGGGGRSNPLMLLKEFNNTDKHRLITTVAVLWGAGPAIGGRGDDFGYPFRPYKGRFHGRVLEDGKRFGEAPLGVCVSPKLMPLLSFGEEVAGVKGLPVPGTLKRIAEQVAEIVEGFGPEFT